LISRLYKATTCRAAWNSPRCPVSRLPDISGNDDPASLAKRARLADNANRKLKNHVDANAQTSDHDLSIPGRIVDKQELRATDGAPVPISCLRVMPGRRNILES